MPASKKAGAETSAAGQAPDTRFPPLRVDVPPRADHGAALVHVALPLDDVAETVAAAAGGGVREQQRIKCTCTITRFERMQDRACPVHGAAIR